MSVVIATTGTEPAIKEAVDYLGQRYGMPPADIQAVNVHAKTGDPIAITVTVFVQDPTHVTQDEYGQPLNAAEMGDAPPDRPQDWRSDPRWPA